MLNSQKPLGTRSYVALNDVKRCNNENIDNPSGVSPAHSVDGTYQRDS